MRRDRLLCIALSDILLNDLGYILNLVHFGGIFLSLICLVSNSSFSETFYFVKMGYHFEHQRFLIHLDPSRGNGIRFRKITLNSEGLIKKNIYQARPPLFSSFLKSPVILLQEMTKKKAKVLL